MTRVVARLDRPNSGGTAFRKRRCRDVLQQVTGGVAITQVRSMEDVVVNSTAGASFQMTLLTIFGAARTLTRGHRNLRVDGVFRAAMNTGNRSSAGPRRRTAKSSKYADPPRHALGPDWNLLGNGSGLGFARVLAGFLFGVKPWDILTFCTVPVFLIAVLLLAVGFLRAVSRD